MGWLVAYFCSDQSVSLVSEKWQKKNGKKCYFPKTKAAIRIKNEAEVDKESGEWGLYSCRILMNGTIFQTYEEARNAEAVAQNHSTMTSFEASYKEKQKTRKHPKVYNTSNSDNECADFKNIAKLTRLDGKSKATTDKEYTYVRDDGAGESGDCNALSADESGSAESDNGVNNPQSVGGQNSENDDNESVTSSRENASERFYEAENDGGGHVNESMYDAVESLQTRSNNLESTSELRSPAADYDFSEDRCIVRVEKLLIHVCRELETIKTDIKALKTKSKDTETVVEKLVAVCKDLSVEVFSCTEEFKKRNGMFTDMLIPDLKLPVTRRKHYNRNDMALEKAKISDNLIKYLASTVNESTEKKFIEGCLNAVFDIKFLTNNVWWKKEPGKVLIKNSQILHCIKESFLMKFGLAEPKKTDKQIERLIYKTCRNLKDKYRKSLVKKKISGNDEDVACDESEQLFEEEEKENAANQNGHEFGFENGDNVRKASKKTAKISKAVVPVVTSSVEIGNDPPMVKRVKKRLIIAEGSNSDCNVDFKCIGGKDERASKEARGATQVYASSDEIQNDAPMAKRVKKRLVVTEDENTECNADALPAIYKGTAGECDRATKKAKDATEVEVWSAEMRKEKPIISRAKKRLAIIEDDDSNYNMVKKKTAAKYRRIPLNDKQKAKKTKYGFKVEEDGSSDELQDDEPLVERGKKRSVLIENKNFGCNAAGKKIKKPKAHF